MKTKLVTLIALVLLSACKKSSSTTSPAPVQVQVSGLTDKTSVSIKITDNSQNGAVILDISNQFGNTTYNTTNVNSGDHITAVYSTNIPDDLQGDGDGTIKFFYKGQQEGATGGILNGTINETIVNP